MSRFNAQDFRDLLNRIDQSAEHVTKQPLREAAFTKEQAINTLAGFRQTAKGSERLGSAPLPENFANQLANGLWNVISWLQSLPDAAPAPAPAAPPPPPAPAAPAPAPVA